MWNADQVRKQTLVLAVSVSQSLVQTKNKNQKKKKLKEQKQIKKVMSLVFIVCKGNTNRP